ncbi:MAG: DotU family type IV/VI secretion system protein, partial [Myxococcota bacterium]
LEGMEPLFGRPIERSEATVDGRWFDKPAVVPDVLEAPDEKEEASDVADLRIRIRERLTWLRSKLGEHLSARDAYNILFPLVIHVDELTAVALGPRASDWRQLQTEFFEIDDGGELFFQKADDLMGQDDTHPLAFEVYRFCLGDGFVGRYGASPSKLDDYKARLSSRISIEAPPVAMDRTEANEIHLVEFPHRFYLISAGTVLSVFLLLHLLTALEVGLW